MGRGRDREARRFRKLLIDGAAIACKTEKEKVETEMIEKMRKLVGKYGSVLQAYRSRGGRAVGAMAAGSVVFAGGVFIVLVLLLPSFPEKSFSEESVEGVLLGGGLALLGLLVILIGAVKHRARIRCYLDFYQRRTGYSVEELQAADRELMGAGVMTIAGKTNRAKEEVMFMITEHYLMSVWPQKGCYLVRLEDIVAVFYSCQIPFISIYVEGLYVISKRDVAGKGQINPLTKKQCGGYYNAIMNGQQNAEAVCMNMVEEIARRVPHVIRQQHIVVNGEKFDLLSLQNWREDWNRILRG